MIEKHRRVYDGSDRISAIVVQGKKLTATVEKALVSASLEYANDKVTELSIEVQDDAASSWWAQDLFAPEGTISFLDWRFQIGPVEDGPGKAGPVVKLTAPSKYVERIRKEEDPGPGQVEVSTWASSAIKTSGASPRVQPELGSRTIEPAETTDGDQRTPSGKLREKPNKWDHLAELRKQTGSWLFEYGSSIVLGKPTWIKAQPWISKFSLRWDSLEEHSKELLEKPRYRHDPSKEDHEAETLKVKLYATDIDQIRTGDLFTYEGKGEQLENASKIVREGQSRKLPTLALYLAVACAMGESTLTIVPYGDAAGPDSRGLFQQRDTWGPLSDRMNAQKSAGLFYAALVKTPYEQHYNEGGNALPVSNMGAAFIGPGKSSRSASLAIHHTQINADPLHYARYWSDAKAVVDACIAAAKESSSGVTGGNAPKAIMDKVRAFGAKYDGVAIDVDGQHGAQCVDSAQRYATEFYGAPYIIGNGKDWWKHPSLASQFVAIPASQPGRAGDIPVWGAGAFGGRYGGYGHVAGPLLEDRGSSVYTFSQNPNPNRKMTLSKEGLLGYMRPRA